MSAKGSRRFRVRSTPIQRENGWNYSDVRIFDGDKEIGGYTRNYGSFEEDTFEPFEIDGKWYALYSSDYTCTRIMSLPDCQDIGGEKPNANGFCPVELFVPRYRIIARNSPNDGSVTEEWKFESWRAIANPTGSDDEYARGPWHSLKLAFVAGCIWGDDRTWKLEVFDLKRASEGILERSARFGYFQLGEMPLPKAIQLHHTSEGEIRADLIRHECRNILTGDLINSQDE